MQAFSGLSAEQRWQLAIEGSNDSVWDWDITANQIYHDDRWARMLGYEPGQWRGRTVWDHVHPDDSERGHDDMRRLLAGETEGMTVERRYVRTLSLA